jgi:hypothetical protein
MIKFKFDYAGKKMTGEYSRKSGEVTMGDGTTFTFTGAFRMAIKARFPGAMNIEVVN